MKKINFTKAVEPYIEPVENLSKVQRLLISIGVVIVIAGAFTWFSLYPKIEEIQKLSKEYKALSEKLETTKKEAANLAFYREKMKEKQIEFNLVKQALPDNKEIPGLLTSISQAGHDSGLSFLLFKPEKEIPMDFYEEIPVSIEVEGGYHNVGLFLSRVANLNRVVNIRDLRLFPQKDGVSLKTSCTAVTYRFVEKKPEPPKKDNKKKK